VIPINDAQVESNETVVVTVLPDPHYRVGSADKATVTIRDND